ncbi:MMPL family transporter [Patulibacter sp. SYSU D01012]|uniref:MMPL family transporter n=1 Tax=Patulibacter sp. SYSU D01012 TaxID=2817381 RepID=UPI001B30BDDA|nr:MMPL family transporter [Patulibacter sp. SYSU D01012]
MPGTPSPAAADPAAAQPPERPPTGLARLVLRAAGPARRRPRTTIALWLLFVVLCTLAGGLTGTRGLTDAEQGIGESGRADARLDAAGLRAPASEVVLVRSATAAATARTADRLVARLRRVPQVAAVQGPRGPQGAQLRRDGGRTALVRLTLRGDPDDAGDHVGPVLDAVAAVGKAAPGVRLDQVGDGSMSRATDDIVAEDLRRAELLSLPVTLLVLVIAFGALVAASVPLLLGITAVAAAMGALGVVSQLVPNGDSTGSLVVLIGLAVGVDYSLFYVRREREERRRGHGPDAALRAASASVGRAILVSGLTVVVALAGLLLTGIPDFTSMAAGTIVVVLIALLGSLTVLPAVLVLLGDRVDRGRLPRVLRPRRRAGAGGLWGGLAAGVTRRPAAALLIVGALLVALAVPALGMRTGDAGVDSLPPDTPLRRSVAAVEAAFPGAPDSVSVVVHGRGLDGHRAGLRALGARARAVTGGRGAIDVAVARDGRTALVAVPRPQTDEEGTRRTIEALRGDVAPAAGRLVPGAHAEVTGGGAYGVDFADALGAKLPLVVGFVLGLAFVLLFAAFRSVRLAATVIALNLLSVGASYGVLVLVFQHTWAEGLLGFTSSGAIVAWMPLLAFVILFGLSMDYSVLVLERIREARLRGLAPREAAADGVRATAGTVTSAAVVMVAVFAIFALLRLVEMKQLGVGLAAAVLLDATLVRGVALPAAVTLLGERAFGLPRRRGSAATATRRRARAGAAD